MQLKTGLSTFLLLTAVQVNVVFAAAVDETQVKSALVNEQSATEQVVTNHLEVVLKQVRHSFAQLNFEASFVHSQGGLSQSYTWLHGIYQQQEIEYIRSQDGINREIVRKGQLTGYFEGEGKSYTVKSAVVQGFLPALLFDENAQLGDYYSVARGGKQRVLDRVTELFRIVSRDQYRHDYWLWLDVQTGLLLKAALVSRDNKVLEQFKMTHLNLLPQAGSAIIQLASTQLPEQLASVAEGEPLTWRLSWLPRGFDVVATSRHQLPLNEEFTDYFLVSDGLAEISVYIQQPLSQSLQAGVLTSGPNVVALHQNKEFDVSVIGKVPANTALRIAEAVTRR